MTWNGVPYSFTNVVEGKYTFWGYEYINVRASLGASTVQKKTADAIANYLINLPPTSLANQATVDTINLSDMHVIRSGDGGDVSNDY